MNTVLLYIIAALLIIILLLTVSVLTVLLWSMVSILPHFWQYVSREEGMRNKIKYLVKVNGKDEQAANLRNGEKKNAAVYGREAESLSRETYPVLRQPEMPVKNQWEESAGSRKGDFDNIKCRPMEIVRKNGETNLIKIRLANPEEMNQYSYKARFEEAPDGDLTVYAEKSGINYVIPTVESISLRDYTSGGMGECFTTDREIKPGMYYKVTGIRKWCKMKRESPEEYCVLEKGVLEVREINS